MSLTELDRRVRRAARAVGRAGLAHAYGHCSARIDSESFLVCAPRPMGLIGVGEGGTVVSVSGPLPAGVLGEVRVHQNIYRLRPEVGGICRTMPPHTMALSTMRLTPKPRHGFGSYFAPFPPLWDDPQLIRDDAAAAKVAATLGQANAIVLRGNGAVVARPTIEEAAVFTWYLEDAARIELEILRAGSASNPAILTPEEAQRRATGDGRIYERMWEYLSAGDPE